MFSRIEVRTRGGLASVTLLLLQHNTFVILARGVRLPRLLHALHLLSPRPSCWVVQRPTVRRVPRQPAAQPTRRVVQRLPDREAPRQPAAHGPPDLRSDVLRHCAAPVPQREDGDHPGSQGVGTEFDRGCAHVRVRRPSGFPIRRNMEGILNFNQRRPVNGGPVRDHGRRTAALAFSAAGVVDRVATVRVRDSAGRARRQHPSGDGRYPLARPVRGTGKSVGDPPLT